MHGCRFSWSYLHETLWHFWPLQRRAHIPAGVFHSDIDWMKTDDEDAAPATRFRGRARAAVSPESTGFLLVARVFPSAFCCGATSPLSNRPIILWESFRSTRQES